MSYKIILFIGILMGVIAQLIMKLGMKRHGKVKLSLKRIHRDILRIYLNVFVFLGVFLYLFAFFIWIFVISKIDLSYAYPLVSVNFVLIALASKIFFKESVSKKRWLSILIILIGVLLVTMS
ncbi:MAG: EamA family transporter [Nanoarchaeota archaeon]|nr:EamA family transporter [Nanoarchaeota archaeon]MBU4242083.1 EamA family transporter [Nanoarchaeota archaeon]MBU4351535.1 EamA family transporter [Nanoarchaeota archaeon]MBU4456477.1 EamA family transporter [Nanoarchaeota archaeon]MCG2720099.1 EamA family transporter [Nanoarchaeota archaeon]